MFDKAFYKQPTHPGFVPPAPGAVAIPEKIGPYKVEGLLNKGGMSLLYLGMRPDTRQLLAIKVLSPELVTHPETKASFLKEARIIGMTDHPNIVKLYDEGEWEGGLFIAMELIRGISLRQFIQQHSLSLKRSLDIVLQVAHALAHLHAHGVVHRDLKPENILITEDGAIKVIDFGIAQLHSEPVRAPHGRLLGTPGYMSPEQKENPAQAVFASDIYSLGVIAYELVLGKLSYGMITLSLLPGGLRKIVEKALAVSVKERYQETASFIADVSHYLRSEEIERDKPGSDQLKELIEVLQKGQLNLSPQRAPDWAEVEVGLAKYKGSGACGVFVDFLKFPNNTMLLLMAESTTQLIDSAIYIASLRGMIRTLIHLKTPSAREVFAIAPFVAALNQLTCQDSLGQEFLCSFLLLDPLRDQLSYLACGMGNLFHIAQESQEPRILSSQNPCLGKNAYAAFAETTDNWNPGDTLLFHSLEAGKAPLESQLLLSLSDNVDLSAQSQAEAILKKAVAAPDFSGQRCPLTLFSIQRIS
jgi:serine/threonine protein kinase